MSRSHSIGIWAGIAIALALLVLVSADGSAGLGAPSQVSNFAHPDLLFTSPRAGSSSPESLGTPASPVRIADEDSTSLSVSPVSGSVGTPVAYTGSGFAPGATVVVSGPDGVPACSNSSTVVGGFDCTSTLPAVPQGSYAVSATDGTNVAAFSSLTVLPDLLVDPAWGPAGTNVSFLGFGWNASDSVDVLWNGSFACVGAAASDGTFFCPTFVVPQAPLGPLKVTANDLDAGGALSASSQFTMTSRAPLEAGPPRASRAVLDVGQSLMLTANVSGGSGVYRYTWIGLPRGCGAGNVDQVQCAPSAPGTYLVQLNVSDSLGAWYLSPSTTILVQEDPFVGSLEATHLSLDVGQMENITATAVGGLAPYTYQWLGLPPGCTSTTAEVSCVPTSEGSYTVSVLLTDALGTSVDSGGLFLAIDPPLVVGPVHANRPGADVAGTVTYFVETTGGGGGDLFRWSGLPSGCANSSSASVTCSPGATGVFDVSVSVTDTNGETQTAVSLPYTIYPQFFAVGFPSESRLTLDLGQTVYFGEEASGGWTPYLFNWSDLPTGCPNEDSDNVSCTPSSPGNWWVEVDVTDRTGAWVSTDAVELTVSAPLQKPDLTADPGTVAAGQSVTLGATVVGGTTIYTYYWTSLPPGCAPLDASVVSCSPSAAGTYTISLTVSDTNGASATSTIQLVVTSSSASPTGGLSWTAFAEVLAAVLVLAVVLAFLLRRRPRGSSPPPARSETGLLPVQDRGPVRAPRRGVVERGRPGTSADPTSELRGSEEGAPPS